MSRNKETFTKMETTTLFFTFFCLTTLTVSAAAAAAAVASPASSLCNGSASAKECATLVRTSGRVETEELSMIMESWGSERLTAEQRRLSYGTLNRNQPACDGGERGQSYSSKCLPPPSNPYKEGCSKHYRCRGDS